MKKSIITIALVAGTLSVNAQSGIITTVAGISACGYTGNGGQATAAELDGAYPVIFDAAGNMYISENANNAIRKVNTAGIITTMCGSATGVYGFGGDGGQATAAKLNSPSGITFDAAGNLYIAESVNIRKITMSTGIIKTIAGSTTMTGYNGEGIPAVSAIFNNVSNLLADGVGNLYLTDANIIRKINTAGIIKTIAGDTTGLTLGFSNNGFSGDGGMATNAKLNSPGGLALNNGNLYFSDVRNNHIRMINTAGIISTVAGYTTATGYSGDGGQATAAGLNQPSGINFDAAGNLFFADAINERIRKITMSTGIITTVAGNGYQSGSYGGYSGDGGQATSAKISWPLGVTFDATGNMFIDDYNNCRIRKVTFGSGAGIEQFTSNNEQVVNIYPNPNNGRFVIETNTTEKQTMQIYDVNGKLALNQTINGKTIIDASNFNEGVYNISIINNEGVINKKVVIIK